VLVVANGTVEGLHPGSAAAPYDFFEGVQVFDGTYWYLGSPLILGSMAAGYNTNQTFLLGSFPNSNVGVDRPGVVQLDVCGNEVSSNPYYPGWGDFFPLPTTTGSANDIGVRGLAFSPTMPALFSAGVTPAYAPALFSFPTGSAAGGGTASLVAAVDTIPPTALPDGAVAFDELGNMYVGYPSGTIVWYSAASLAGSSHSAPVANVLSAGLGSIASMVHNGIGTLFVAGTVPYGSTGCTNDPNGQSPCGVVWQVSTVGTGPTVASAVHTGTYSPLNGITLDSNGNMWVLEVSGVHAAGALLEFAPGASLPASYPSVSLGPGAPGYISIFGESLPAIRNANAAGAVGPSPGVAPTATACPKGNAPQSGDVLVTLHTTNPSVQILGLNPSTRIYYPFATGIPANQDIEIGNIVTESTGRYLVIGDVSGGPGNPVGQTGVIELDSCGNMTSPTPWGTFVSLTDPSFGTGMNETLGVPAQTPRGIALDSSGDAFSFFTTSGDPPIPLIFRIPFGGGSDSAIEAAGTVVLGEGPLDGDPIVAFDESGDLFVGGNTNGGTGGIVEYASSQLADPGQWNISSPTPLPNGVALPLNQDLGVVQAMVYGGQGVLFVTATEDAAQPDPGAGVVWKVDTIASTATPWATMFTGGPLGPLFGQPPVPLGILTGITLRTDSDNTQSLWAIQAGTAASELPAFMGIVKIPVGTPPPGSNVDFFPFPTGALPIGPSSAAGAATLGNQALPWGIAVYGQTLP
jgi:hypothetical protein